MNDDISNYHIFTDPWRQLTNEQFPFVTYWMLSKLWCLVYIRPSLKKLLLMSCHENYGKKFQLDYLWAKFDAKFFPLGNKRDVAYLLLKLHSKSYWMHGDNAQTFKSYLGSIESDLWATLIDPGWGANQFRWYFELMKSGNWRHSWCLIECHEWVTSINLEGRSWSIKMRFQIKGRE